MSEKSFADIHKKQLKKIKNQKKCSNKILLFIYCRSETDVKLEPQLKLNDITPGLQNISPKIISEMVVEASIRKRDKIKLCINLKRVINRWGQILATNFLFLGIIMN